MARRSYRKPAQTQRDNVGCMWGLIGLFDFRQGHSTQKLMLDKKLKSTRLAGTGPSGAILDSLESSLNKHEGGSVSLVNMSFYRSR